MSESLLPGTDAITNSTLEWDQYRGKWLVRLKDRHGSVQRVLTESYAEADAAFERFWVVLR